MEIKNAKFVQSVSNGKVIPSFDAPEIAIAGKSNVGKSSFINFMVNQNKLARTSGDPGRTRLVNFFEINGGEFYFVDLPGYGYAKVSKEEKAKWGPMIEGYLENGKNHRVTANVPFPHKAAFLFRPSGFFRIRKTAAVPCLH